MKSICGIVTSKSWFVSFSIQCREISPACSVGRAWDSSTQGRGFEPHVGRPHIAHFNRMSSLKRGAKFLAKCFEKYGLKNETSYCRNFYFVFQLLNLAYQLLEETIHTFHWMDYLLNDKKTVWKRICRRETAKVVIDQNQIIECLEMRATLT